MRAIKIFSPATVANVCCGFDVLGFSLESPVGDEMIIRKVSKKGLKITKIEGAKLPLTLNKNVVGIAAQSLLNAHNYSGGFEIEIYKKIKPGSGMGSSAASSAGVVWGINKLLGKPFSNKQLIEFAMQGEKLASGVAHPDNVAPALLGGFTLVRSTKNLDIINLPIPKKIHVVVIHPKIEVKTADSRKVLEKKISIQKATEQWANLAAFMSAIYTKDYDLMRRSLKDVIVEPRRALFIPKYNDLKEVVLETGALGGGISGSGPSFFALTKGKEKAIKVATEFRKIFEPTGIDFNLYQSKISKTGVKSIK